MKRLYYILALGALISSQTMDAQEQPERRTPQATRGSRAQTEQQSGLPDLTVRAQDLNERNTQEIGNARWMRVLYREIDLTKDENAPLYYPVRPLNGQMNLFSMIFQLLSEGKIKVYEYHDGYESFAEEDVIPFKTVLDNAYIYYEEVPGRTGGQPSYVVNESDVPSAEVKRYYVKEAWYFDQNNSLFDVKTLALCPIMTIYGDFGEETTPLFWLPYEDIRPYINTAYIMTSNLNNAKTFTMDDYFRRRMFKGDIIKTENLMNRTLAQIYPEPDSMALAQDTIEKQLAQFNKQLWFQPDTTTQATNTKATKSSSRGRVATTKAPKEPKEKAAKAPKAEKASTGAVRSVRRRR
ncbi:gliding motility associated protein GldN [Parabacteroides sp. PFB2-12]|uniref:type IX secretion system ring protein PorN/GldN n=1 Tax=unclassified Parabacteroides TaxID=2649774 RepID=UPI0024771FD7|nr:MULTISPECIES: gliding motility protein GldN [unclassified Parabacteroides]MDH6341369.1 gliding motility associated protein GldN [Parabacteroides sp. PM6-13]MDH6389163.1 gliding motility associated protein GldN [Parabacteroides sp. PFB2-12]